MKKNKKKKIFEQQQQKIKANQIKCPTRQQCHEKEDPRKKLVKVCLVTHSAILLQEISFEDYLIFSVFFE